MRSGRCRALARYRSGSCQVVGVEITIRMIYLLNGVVIKYARYEGRALELQGYIVQ